MRQVAVVGHGEVKARPDTATVQIGVETEAATAKDALAQNNAQAQALQKKLAELGVDAKDMQTSNFSIFPAYGTDGRQVTGYRVSNTVTVTIRQLDQAGALLDQVVLAAAGGASVGDVLVISENVSSPPVVPLAMLDRAAAEQAPSVPVQPGEQSFSVDVQATFALR
jgi:uncharacterized protein YggE